jgi:hypothetical protein
MKIKKKIIALMISLIAIPSISFAQTAVGKYRFGIDGGLGMADLQAEKSGQAIANATGSNTTASWDTRTWMVRPFVNYGVTKEVSAELGFFYSGSLNANYRTASGITASESYKVFGLDAAAVYTWPEGYFVKAGLHRSQVDGTATVRLSNGSGVNLSGYSYGVNGLLGIGYESPSGFRVGYTYYKDVGNYKDSDVGMLYVGYKF